MQTWQDFRWELLQSSVNKSAGAEGGEPDPGYVSIEVQDARQQIVFRRLNLAPLREQGYEGDPLGLLGVNFSGPSWRRCSAR